MNAIIIAYFVVIIAAIWGWVMNLVDVVQAVAANAPFDTLLIGRIVGIPVGVLGAVLGWF